jgi:hypothetical protein
MNCKLCDESISASADMNRAPKSGRCPMETHSQRPPLDRSRLVRIQGEWRVIRYEHIGVFASASPGCFNGGNVDLLHRHHRLESTLCLTATSRKRIG